MRGFTINARSLVSSTPSYANAIAAGSLSHTGNSVRPIGAPVKVVSGPVSQLVQPTYGGGSVPRANPVGVTPPVRLPFSVPRANPITHSQDIRGILGS